MKNVIFVFLFAISCSLTAYAEVLNSINDEVADVGCYLGQDKCDITYKNDEVETVTKKDLVKHFYVVDVPKNGFYDDEFVYNANQAIIGLNPATYGKPTQTQSVSQPVQQQASEPPYKLSGYREGFENNVEILSMVNGLHVNKVIVNEGGCPLTTTYRNIKRDLKMGEKTGFGVLNTCNIIKLTIETNQGSWTHTMQ